MRGKRLCSVLIPWAIYILCNAGPAHAGAPLCTGERQLHLHDLDVHYTAASEYTSGYGILTFDNGELVGRTWSNCPGMAFLGSSVVFDGDGMGGWYGTGIYEVSCGPNTFAYMADWHIDCHGNLSGYHIGQYGDRPHYVMSGAVENVAPYPPYPLFPENGAPGIPVDTALGTSRFMDPDSGDRHAVTDWWVSSQPDFSDSVLRTQTGRNLESLAISPGVLEYDRPYYWRARHGDAAGNLSGWSSTASFTTESSRDANGNGVPDSQEVSRDVDLDRDGIPDIDQADIRSVNTESGRGQMGVKVSGGVGTLEVVQSIDPLAISDVGRPSNLPLDLVGVRVGVPAPGSPVTLKVVFSEPAAANALWYQYDPLRAWQDFSAYARFAEDRMSVELDLQDGGRGDADGVANGIVVDPGGFGVASWLAGTVTADREEGIAGADVTIGNHVLKTIADGSYLGVVMPGNWDVTVSAPGYEAQTVAGVDVPEGGIRDLDVVLGRVPEPRLRVNGIRRSTAIPAVSTFPLEISLDGGGHRGTAADWWLVVDTPSGWYFLDLSAGMWKPWFPDLRVTYQGDLFDIPWIDVSAIPGLPGGSGIFSYYFGVDETQNGIVDAPLYFDYVSVTLTSG